ncbi:MAG: ATP synthase F1 subunit gamma [Bacteroidetes bacterium SB0662_bin_6]|nr:ATP synthase F1 subunit gamma [Bacteroidetes bacterium SB0668_bin_1]MYE04469.1 ATP synthase F1 subunit gamma [Bacteroidetes bacterium SB0662_bin_6]
MANLRDIRNRIESIRNTQQVTRAMKMVAAAKLRRAQERIFSTRPYAYRLGAVISRLKEQLDATEHPLLQEREETRSILFIVVTADRGLAGAFNANIVKEAEQAMAAYEAVRKAGNLHVLAAGRKGHDHFTRRGYKMVGDFRGIFDRIEVDTARKIVEQAVDGYLNGSWDEVKIVYNEFRNTIAQNRVVEPFLPIPKKQFLTPIMEARGKGDAQADSDRTAGDSIFEPEAESVLHELLPRYLHYQVWRVLLESNAAEQGARMVAMDNATSNAEEFLRNLKLKYNRARQSAITTEIIEIVSGANALEAG